MADRCAIQPLDVSTFPTPDDVSNPGFTELFNELVGDAGTSADGFDADVEEANSLLDAIDNALSDLGGADGGTLDDTFEDVLAFDPTDAGTHVVEATAAIADAQTDVDQLGNTLTAASSPAPGGGGGGSGGGGGGGAAGGCVVVDLGQVDEYTGGVFTHEILPFSLGNAGNGPLTVKGISWSQNLPTIFSISPNIVGAQIAPGASLAFDIVVTTAGDGPITNTLTIQTDARDPQPCITVKLVINPNPSTPTSGPSGPQPQQQRLAVVRITR